MSDLPERIMQKVDDALEVLVHRSFVGVDELTNYLLDIRLECSGRLEPEGDNEQLQEELAADAGAYSGVS